MDLTSSLPGDMTAGPLPNIVQINNIGGLDNRFQVEGSAAIRAGSIVVPDSGKFSTARCVCARHSAAAGTRTSPIESCSTR